MLNGFNLTRKKILTGIIDPDLKQRFLNKLDLLAIKYSSNGIGKGTSPNPNDSTTTESELATKLHTIIEDRISNFSPKLKTFSSYLIKNSLIQKLYSIVLNKKILISAFSIFFVLILFSIIKKFKIIDKLSPKLTVYSHIIQNTKLFNIIGSFFKGTIKLLVNY
jgi:hypothetical protein